MVRTALCFFVACVGSSLADDDTGKTKLPRYRFDVGTRLTYAVKYAWIVEGVSIEELETHRIWVLEAASADSWRLLLHWEVKDGKEAPRMNQMMVSADGAHRTQELGRYDSPIGVWKRLPRSGKEMRTGWTESLNGSRESYRILSGGSDQLVFKQWAGNKKCTVTHDLIKSVPTRLEYRAEDDGQVSSVTHTLLGIEKVEDAELDALRKDSAAYLAAKAAGTFSYKGARMPRLREQYAESRDKLRRLNAKTKTQLVRVVIAGDLASLDEQLRLRLANAEHYHELMNQPAPRWTLRDTDGEKHRSETYEDKIVVLDFWHSSCGFCRDAMPQVKDVARRFENKRVVVIGINVSDSVKKARATALEAALNYPTLVNGGAVATRFGVRGLPSFVIIDRKGIVRDVVAGYSPDLAKDMASTITGLLSQ